MKAAHLVPLVECEVNCEIYIWLRSCRPMSHVIDLGRWSVKWHGLRDPWSVLNSQRPWITQPEILIPVKILLFRLNKSFWIMERMSICQYVNMSICQFTKAPHKCEWSPKWLLYIEGLAPNSKILRFVRETLGRMYWAILPDWNDGGMV